MRLALVLFLVLVPVAALAETVLIDGVEIPYRLVENCQSVDRSTLARAFPRFSDGQDTVDLEELARLPHARVTRRDGRIVSIRYYDRSRQQIYELSKPAPRPVPVAPTRPAAADASGMTEIEAALAREMIDISNQRRAENGVEPLAQEDHLVLAAVGHSREMLELNYFSHTSPKEERKTTMERVRLTGVAPTGVGENIHRCGGFSIPEIARKVVDDWMNSPGHRRNLLDPGFHKIGIGVVSKGNTYVTTQVFGSGF
ncbi:MAG: CAP domain-containing protein [Armatimonadetes bacterium]|nr:CAP domain-containing protein [Armatimonadota bacterium]